MKQAQDRSSVAPPSLLSTSSAFDPVVVCRARTRHADIEERAIIPFVQTS